MSRKNFILVSILLALSFLTYLSLYINLSKPVVQFTAISIFSSAIFVLLIILFRKTELNIKAVLWIAGVGIVFRLILFPIGPIASDDVYRYIWDGKVQSAGYNPYTFAPNDEELSHLKSDLLPEKVSYPEMRTIYPPYSQWMFLLAYLIGGETLFGFKFLLLISEIFTIVLMIGVLSNLKKPLKYVLVYAISPLPILQFFVDAHLDGFGITLIVLFVYLFTKDEKRLSYFVLGLSIAAKLISGILYPLILKEKSMKNFFAVILIPLLTIIIIYFPYSINSFPFESLLIFSQNWTSNGSIFSFIHWIISDNQTARIVSMIFFFGSFLYLYFSNLEFWDKAYLIFFFFFLCSPVVHPWYITWVGALLVFSFRWSGIAFISMISLANLYAVNFQLSGKWEIESWILLVQYAPVFILFTVELFMNKTKRINLLQS